MANSSLIGKSVILVSALVGGLVGVLELSDRFMSPEPEAEPTPPETVEAAQPVDEPSDVDTQPSVTAERPERETVPAGSPLEQELWRRAAAHLARQSCTGVTVDRLQATALVIPEADTSHGFQGHTLDGAIELRVGSITNRIRLAGSGKGPTGATAAVDMALRGFQDSLEQTDFFKENCMGE